MLVYEIISNNKPKQYTEVVDQICETINKNRQKADKKEASRQLNKEKRGLLVRKDTAELEEDRIIEKKFGSNKSGKLLRKDTADLEEERIEKKNQGGKLTGQNIKKGGPVQGEFKKKVDVKPTEGVVVKGKALHVGNEKVLKRQGSVR